MQTVYGLPTKCVGYMGLIWSVRRNTNLTLPIIRKLWVVFHQFGNILSVKPIFVLSVMLSNSIGCSYMSDSFATMLLKKSYIV